MNKSSTVTLEKFKLTKYYLRISPVTNRAYHILESAVKYYNPTEIEERHGLCIWYNSTQSLRFDKSTYVTYFLNDYNKWEIFNPRNMHIKTFNQYILPSLVTKTLLLDNVNLLADIIKD